MSSGRHAKVASLPRQCPWKQGKGQPWEERQNGMVVGGHAILASIPKHIEWDVTAWQNIPLPKTYDEGWEGV